EDKDTDRNVGIYLQVPGIREYWIFDPRPNWLQPSLTVYRRRGSRWQKPIEVAFAGVYETPRLLPAVSPTVHPRAALSPPPPPRTHTPARPGRRAARSARTSARGRGAAPRGAPRAASSSRSPPRSTSTTR